MSEQPAVSVVSVSKTFKLPHEKQNSIKGLFVNVFRGERTYERQEVLHNISFEVKKGEFFGVVGRNGSGKSTLLKLLAGIYSPNKGAVHVNGKLTPFIELGVGFNPELTGRENVFLNGALLGFNRKEMLAMYDEIVAFAEIERFMDQKLKNYSSGMQVRLAFSIAIRAKSDILLIDEVLAVGDVNFQTKCLAIFEELKRAGTTIIFVSHDMESVRRFCDRVILIENGKITQRGEAQSVIDAYMTLNAEKMVDSAKPFGLDNIDMKDDSKLKILSTEILDSTFNPATKITVPNEYCLEVKIKFLEECKDLVPGVLLRNQAGIRVSASNTTWANYKLPTYKAGEVVKFRFTFPNVLEKGIYFVSSNAYSSTKKQFYDWDNDASRVFIENNEVTGGVINPNYRITVVTEK